MNKKYTISLDIGTASVGWAVLKDDCEALAQLARANKKIKIISNGSLKTKKTRANLWGVRLFESAQTAEDRRLKRGQRRRILRRTKRINYLREIFEQEIFKFDANFFERLNESFLVNADEKKAHKIEKGKGLLFAGKYGEGESYNNDADYYEKFPTIYHLRQHLMNTTHKVDIRLIYLALHHIIKYRGHFVNQGQNIDVSNFNVINDLSNFICACIENEQEEDFENYNAVGGFTKNSLSTEKLNAANVILVNKKLPKSKKVEELTNIFGTECKDVFTAVVGNSINLERIFANTEYKHGDENNIPKPSDFKFSLEAEKLDEEMSKVSTVLTEHENEILTLGKNVYSSIVLSGILTKPTLSESMIEKYDMHKKQLKELKNLIRQTGSSNNYKAIFNDYNPSDTKRSGLYALYINEPKNMPMGEFYKKLKDFLPKEATHIYEAMEMENYLQKQRYRVNGEIPYQIHEHELCKIIDNQKAHYPFLGQLHTTKRNEQEYKINTLMKFRIPYYVGPLAMHKNYSKNSWLEKINDTSQNITPWNFDSVVDADASNANFIERMTSFCTYLPNEKVLPKHSLIYQEYVIYNELMSCGYYVRGENGKSKKEFFNATLKQKIVDKLFKRERNVTLQKLLNFLDKEELISITKSQLFGVDTIKKGAKFNGTYSTYIDIFKALNDDLNDEAKAEKLINQHKSHFEEIIKWATIFEDREILKRKIKLANEQQWGHFLTNNQVLKLSKLRYRGWGRISAKLINGLKTSENKTILESLKSGQYNNFMRLLQDKNIQEAIKSAETKNGTTGGLNYELVEAIAGSPAIKKGIWQSIKVVQELEDFLGKEKIEKIVIEVSRDMGNKKGKRTKTRWQKLDELYSNFKEKTGQNMDKDLIEKLFSYKGNEKKLDDERLFLYFLQNGKCMYSQEPLEISNLSSYEIDHIIPQSLITDNSFDNIVLVKRIENQKKAEHVLSPGTIKKMLSFWTMLADSGQISQRKLENLKRDTITDNDRSGFINRQLVETRQITKHVANILLNHYEGTETEILTPRAGLTNIFRKEFKLEKSREINDYHHAHDAFLNGIVALYAYKTLPALKDLWVYGNYSNKISKAKSNKYLNNIIHSMKENDTWVDEENGEIIAKKDSAITMIKKVLTYRNISIIKKTEIMTGKFSNETIGKKGKDKIPVKMGLNTSLYGGRVSPESAFTVVIKNAKGEIKALSIPVLEAMEYTNALDKLSFLQKLYPKAKITDVIIEKLGKYTKYCLPSGGVRLLASYQEAQNGVQMKMYTPPTKESSNDELLQAYILLCTFIDDNKLFVNSKIDLLKNEMRENFINSDHETMLKAVNELMRVVNGRNQGLKVLSSIGLGTTAQQLKSDNLITNGTTIIHQSVTGLYETQVLIQ